MSLPTSLSAYRDCQSLFDQALSGAKGARFKLPSYEECVQLRVRLHYFRKLDRIANKETYPPKHPSHGQSIYDTYVVQIVPDEDFKTTGEYWLYIQKRGANILAAELLDDDNDFITIDSQPVDASSYEVRQIESDDLAPSALAEPLDNPPVPATPAGFRRV